MTTPLERANAVKDLQQAALDAVAALDRPAGKSGMVKVERSILKRMGRALKHYPSNTDLHETALARPDLWKA